MARSTPTKATRTRKAAKSTPAAKVLAKKPMRATAAKGSTKPRIPVKHTLGATAGWNRLSRRLAAVSMHNPDAVDKVVVKTPSSGVELASTFRQQFASGPAQ